MTDLERAAVNAIIGHPLFQSLNAPGERRQDRDWWIFLRGYSDPITGRTLLEACKRASVVISGKGDAP